MEDEEKPGDEKITHIPENAAIKLNNISFRYTGGLELCS